MTELKPKAVLACLLLICLSAPGAADSPASDARINAQERAQPRAQEYDDDLAVDAELRALEAAAPSAAGRARLRELLHYQERSRIAHPEHRALTLPRFELAARAQVLLQRWDQQALLDAMHRQPALRAKAGFSSAELGALQRWLQQAPAAELELFRQQHALTQLPEPLLARLTQRQWREDERLELARRGQLASSLRLLQTWLDQASAAQRLQLLQSMRGNPQFASAAARQLQRWSLSVDDFDPAPSARWDRFRVEALLQGPASIARAQLHDALAHPQFAALAAWGLWRLHDAESLQLLADFSSDPQTPSHLAAEIRSWLR